MSSSQVINYQDELCNKMSLIKCSLDLIADVDIHTAQLDSIKLVANDLSYQLSKLETILNEFSEQVKHEVRDEITVQ